MAESNKRRIFNKAIGYSTSKLSAAVSKLELNLNKPEAKNWSSFGLPTSPGITRISSYFSTPTPAHFSSTEQIISHDGHATLRTPKSLQHDSRRLEILVSGYAVVSRPLEQASRSQKLFYSLARTFSALPPTKKAAEGTDEPLEIPEEAIINSDGTEIGFDQLLSNMNENLIDLAEDEPIPLPTTPGSNPTLVRRPGLPRGLSQTNTPSRRSTAPVSSISRPNSRPNSIHDDSKPNSRPNSIYFNGYATELPLPLTRGRPFPLNAQPQPFKIFDESELSRLHYNLQTRLKPFFAGKLVARSVRVSVYPHSEKGHLFDSPLISKILSTNAEGKFEDTLMIPFSVTKEAIKNVRIITELLVLPAEELIGEALEVSCSDETILSVVEEKSEGRKSGGGGVRVISDIDDTIKHSCVLGSSKEIFRNVFVRELDEIQVPGMADWYRAMEMESVGIHYVSNGPVELFAVVKEFLHVGGFPSGSITLKSYGGGGGIISNLMSDAGVRKRAGLVKLLLAFPLSKFLLVGDSGEQDIIVFTSIALEYPKRVIGIFIRDVTTPLIPKPIYTDSSSTDSSTTSTPANSRPNSIHFDLIPSTAEISLTRPKLSKKLKSFTKKVITEDPLSPNNPIQTQTLIPLSETEEGIAKISMFLTRVKEAENVLPSGIVLRIFRDGRDVMEEGIRLVKENR